MKILEHLNLSSQFCNDLRVLVTFVPFIYVTNLLPIMSFVSVPATSAEQACLETSVTL
jgi:hypothetical protein